MLILTQKSNLFSFFFLTVVNHKLDYLITASCGHECYTFRYVCTGFSLKLWLSEQANQTLVQENICTFYIDVSVIRASPLKGNVLRWLQSTTPPLDATKSYKLVRWEKSAHVRYFHCKCLNPFTFMAFTLLFTKHEQYNLETGVAQDWLSR